MTTRNQTAPDEEMFAHLGYAPPQAGEPSTTLLVVPVSARHGERPRLWTDSCGDVQIDMPVERDAAGRPSRSGKADRALTRGSIGSGWPRLDHRLTRGALARCPQGDCAG